MFTTVKQWVRDAADRLAPSSGSHRRSGKDSGGTVNRNKDLRGRFCPAPFRQMDVYEGGAAYLCCSAWLPVPVGNIKHGAIHGTWNSRAAKAVRESIFDGSFRYCDHQVCPRIQNDSLPRMSDAAQDPQYRRIIRNVQVELNELPTFLNLCNDVSCNLFCPSCRTRRINHTRGRELKKRQDLQNKLVRTFFAGPTDRAFTLSVTGSGDPFASRVFREFLFALDGSDFPNLNINLQTNGVLLTPRNWRRLAKVHRNINAVTVSLDAGTEATYRITRRGGHWPTLMKNIRYLGEARRSGQLNYLRLDFVVQRANYREMPEYIAIGQSIGADQVGFSMLLNWNTWSDTEFEAQCVWKRNHPEFDRFMAVLRSPVFEHPIVDLGNITEYRKRAVAGTVQE